MTTNKNIMTLQYLFKTNKKQFIQRAILSLKSRLLVFWNPNPKCRAIVSEQQTYRKLKKEFSYVFKDMYNQKEEKIAPDEYTVWVCWLQGIEQAPDLVKVCVDNLHKRLNNYKIITLTEENYNKYASIPDYIVEKWKKGVISNAHFSDLLRLEILDAHGGVWIDSTVYCTVNGLPDYITNNSPFVYSSFTLNGISVNKISSWLMACYPHDKFIRATKALLYEYWKKYDYIIDYYLIHMFFSIVTDFYSKDWNDLPSYHNLNPHILQFEFDKPFDEQRMKEICRFADFHKLTYRLEKKCKNIKGSYYDILINQKYEVNYEK